MKTYTFLIGCILLSLFVSCDSNTIIDENVSIPKKAWDHTNKPTFKVHITDISKKYNMWLNVRHTANYPYANLLFWYMRKVLIQRNTFLERSLN